jgi:sulfite reductase alpha subunit-like flavoprotein
LQGSGIEFQPGDTIGVIPENSKDEVEKVMKHLRVSQRADTVVTVSMKPGAEKKKKACVPPHIPTKATLRHILQTCLDIRAIPKKVIFADYGLVGCDTAQLYRWEHSVSIFSIDGNTLKNYLMKISKLM